MIVLDCREDRRTDRAERTFPVTRHANHGGCPAQEEHPDTESYPSAEGIFLAFRSDEHHVETANHDHAFDHEDRVADLLGNRIKYREKVV